MENQKQQILTEDQLTQFITEIETLPDQISKAGIEYFHANAEASRLEELKKNVLCTIKNNISLSTEKNLSEASLERLSYASNKYKEHINEMIKEREKANLKRVEYEKQLKTFEMLRTLISLEKAKMGL